MCIHNLIASNDLIKIDNLFEEEVAHDFLWNVIFTHTQHECAIVSVCT